MDRPIVYPGSLPQDTDILTLARNMLVANGIVTGNIFGALNTTISGLAVTPTSPASLSVLVGPGSISTPSSIDATAYGTLAADLSPLTKTGINTGSTTLTFAAPTVSGQSIIYLIQVTFGEVDSNPVVIPYYNASNPSQPFLGAANSGNAQYTTRREIVQIQAKASAPASSPSVPAADTGWYGIATVTIPFAATTVTSGNITTLANSARLPMTLPVSGGNVATAITSAGYTVDGTPGQLWQAIQFAAAQAGASAAIGYTPVKQGNSNTISLQWDGTAIDATVNGTDLGELATRPWVTAGFQPAGSYQPNLGFTPVQQSGGSGQSSSKIYLGWNGSALNAQVDGNTTVVGNIASQTWVGNNFPSRQEFTLSGGVMKLPNGYIIQTFGGALPSGGTGYFNYPVAFPTNCFCVVGTIGPNGDPQAALQVAPVAYPTAGYNTTCLARLTGSGGGSNGLNFVAFGY